MSTLRINSERLHNRMEMLAKIGARPDGGVCRLAFSQLDLDGRTYVRDLMEEAGLEVRIDAVGNLFGIWHSTNSKPALMVGSHTDTVATGGQYDGSLGVLAALEAVETILEQESGSQQTLIVASFVNEEGVRFMPDMMGSLYFTGELSLAQVRSSEDSQGISIGQELDRLSYGGTDSLDDIPVGAFLELHIEQGPVLEEENLEIGVVTGVQGLSWTEVTVRGASNHAGTTPMRLRKDAGRVSNTLMYDLQDLTSQIENLRLTIGSVHYHPNLVNVIANEVRFTIDARHPDLSMLQETERRIAQILDSQTDCFIDYHSIAKVNPLKFSHQIVSAVQEAADHLALPAKQMISGAGHDAQILGAQLPAGMIFIPSRNGISHSIEEYSTPSQVENGANVLLHAIQTMANQ